MALRFILICFASLFCQQLLASSHLQYRALASAQQRELSLWHRQPSAAHTLLQTLDWQYQQQPAAGHQLQLAATGWQQQRLGRLGSSDSGLTFSEAWWAVDEADWSFSVGKRKRDFDVNHALRPLDMFSPTDTLALYTLVAPGVWQLSADWFGSHRALTLLCNETRQPFLRQGQPLPASWGCGARYYQQADTLEWQTVLHHDAQIGWRAGGSLQQVVTDALALQMSLVWQQRSWQSQWIHWPAATASQQVTSSQLRADRPLVQAVAGQSAWQVSTGLNYTFSSGYNLLLEFGYDGQAPAAQDWQTLRHRLAQQPLLPLEQQSSQQLAGAARFSQTQWLLHLRSTPSGAWQHTLTLLQQPAVRGLLISASLSYSIDHHSNFSLGIKHFGGATNNAFALLGLRSEVVAGVSYVF